MSDGRCLFLMFPMVFGGRFSILGSQLWWVSLPLRKEPQFQLPSVDEGNMFISSHLMLLTGNHINFLIYPNYSWSSDGSQIFPCFSHGFPKIFQRFLAPPGMKTGGAAVGASFGAHSQPRQPGAFRMPSGQIWWCLLISTIYIYIYVYACICIYIQYMYICIYIYIYVCGI